MADWLLDQARSIPKDGNELFAFIDRVYRAYPTDQVVKNAVTNPDLFAELVAG